MKYERELRIIDITDRPDLPDSCLDPNAMRGASFAVLSLNPGVDRALYLSGPMRDGELNRAARSVTTQGSKGANVAIMLKRLGCQVDYYSFTGGEFGELCESFLDRENITSHLVRSGCGVRMNTKVIDSEGVCTELNERGGVFLSDEVSALTELFTSTSADVICLCGSIPQGVEKDVYKVFAEFGKLCGKVVVLDCDGDALRLGIEGRPDVIKPNEYELERFGLDTGLFEKFSTDCEEREKDITDACVKVSKTYGTVVLCTRAGNGAIVALPDGKVYKRDAIKVGLRGFSGAGDCFLAGYIAARYNKGFNEEFSLVCAIAAGGAKIRLEGSLLPESTEVDDCVDMIINPATEEVTEIPIENTIMEGIEPWNIKKIFHSKTKKS